MNQILEDFCNKLKVVVKPEDLVMNEPMKYHTSFKVGGPADIMVTPGTFEEVATVVGLCKKNNVPCYIIGNGSNLLVRDGGIRGVVVKLAKLDGMKLDGEKIIAQSGAELKAVSEFALANSLTGFEFACGIPGSVGGAVTMNAGAYGGEVCCVIESALVLDSDGNLRILNKDELELGYRMSAILKYGYIVLEVTFKLQNGDHSSIKARIDELSEKRKEKQPLEYPSAGSTFKRPEGYFAGKLIQDSGLKGVSVGGAQVSPKHSGFIINKGDANANDILDLIALVQNTVKEKYNVDLHTEVRIIGEE